MEIITPKAWDDPAKREPAVSFVFHMASEESLSSFATTEVTALVSDADPTGLNTIQQSAADTDHFARIFKKPAGMSANEYHNSLK